VLKRVGFSRLPANCRRRSIVSLRYEKQVPGHHVQIDVKFPQFKDADGRLRKRYQFTAIGDATRIRALRIYERHNQQSAVDLIDHVVERSHLTDQLEFYQLLDYTGDVDLRAKLAVWEEFYNLQRPHASLGGRTPNEVLRDKLLS
jgi:transposase InsO family protein